MRIRNLMATTMVAASLALAASASAQVNISVRFGTGLGPAVDVFAYTPERMGDWHANYRKWTPVTLYDVNGHYYRKSVSGARAVVVYSYNGEYFLPPTDREWAGFDKRYNYKRAPAAVDMGRARPYAPPVPIRAQLGTEIGVFGYASDRAGDWHKNYRKWAPVTVYEFNGRYYQNNAAGTRAVQIYRYKDEYFLPPQDHDWVGADKRFDYQHQPNDADRKRVRERP
jgi:hypothetical protein